MGLLWGNGNHCDYFAGDLRSFEGTADAVTQAYAVARLADPVTGQPAEPSVAFLQGCTMPDVWGLPNRFESINDWGVTPEPNAQIYIVYLSRSYEANSDLRCH